MFSLQPPRHISTLPETVAPIGRVRVRCRGQTSRASQRPARQFLTHFVTSPPPIAALRKGHSITSLAVICITNGTVRPSVSA